MTHERKGTCTLSHSCLFLLVNHPSLFPLYFYPLTEPTYHFSHNIQRRKALSRRRFHCCTQAPWEGGEKRGKEGGKEGGNRDVYSELNHWSLRHTAQEISSALIFHFDSEKNRSWLSKTWGRWNMWADKDSHCGSSYLILLNWVIQTVCYMQIPFMIMQHVKHKASALITSTHPPTTALPLPTSLPAQRGAGGWVGEGGYLL